MPLFAKRLRKFRKIRKIFFRKRGEVLLANDLVKVKTVHSGYPDYYKVAWINETHVKFESVGLSQLKSEEMKIGDVEWFKKFKTVEELTNSVIN